MRKILKIAQREYLETVKTKTFLLSLFFAPVVTIGAVYLATAMSRTEGPRPPVKVAVTDLSAQLAADVENAISEHNRSNPKRQIIFESLNAGDDANSADQRGRAKLRSGSIDAWVVIDTDIIEGPGKVHFYTYKSKAANMDALWTVERIINDAVVARRCKIQNVSPQLLADIRNVPVVRLEIGAEADQQRVESRTETAAKMMIPFFFMFLMYMGILGISQQMLSSVIEEKNSRIIEMLLSAASPFELMAGKILGLGAIGLTVVALWITAAFGAARWQAFQVDVTARLLLSFTVFYILGFLLFSSLLAAIGSMCNTLKETQDLMMPVVLLMVLPMVSWFKLVQSPDGAFARVLSFVPPVSPLVMPLRISAGSNVGLLEISASVALLVLALLATIWLAAKIFRTGILMYGKRPSPREILRWLRTT